MSIKGSEACQNITFVCCSSFLVLLFSTFSSLAKRYQITEVSSLKSCIVLHWFLFCSRNWPFLLLPGRTYRTWTILWTGGLLSKPAATVWPHQHWWKWTMTTMWSMWQCVRHHKLCGSVLRKSTSGKHFFRKKNLELLFQGKWRPWKS